MEVRLEAEELRTRGLEPWLGPDPFVLEIGFGRADLLLALAADSPERRFLGVEISRKRVAKAERRIRGARLENAFVVHAPAEYLLEVSIPDACVDLCWVNCPDPWPKARHQRRRVFQPAFARQLARVLIPGARLHACTDHSAYAEWIDSVLRERPELENVHAPRPWSEQRPDRPETAYEREWLAEGRSMAYFEYLRCARTP